MTEQKRTLHEAAHKVDHDGDGDGDGDGDAGVATKHVHKRTFHEAAHKLGYWGPPACATLKEPESEEARKRSAELADYHRDVIATAGRAVLALGALGVVYGDIG